MATNNTVNRIELIGYMGAMPEMRFTANGLSVTNFSLATNRIWRDQSGETCKATDWHRRQHEQASGGEETTGPPAG